MTGGVLAGQDLLVSHLPADSFTAPEAVALGAFLDGGGNVLLTGEFGGSGFTANPRINGLLGMLESSMSLVTASLDNPGTEFAIGPLVANELTTGIAPGTFAFGYSS